MFTVNLIKYKRNRKEVSTDIIKGLRTPKPQPHVFSHSHVNEWQPLKGAVNIGNTSNRRVLVARVIFITLEVTKRQVFITLKEPH
jgi:hypothetical protein